MGSADGQGERQPDRQVSNRRNRWNLTDKVNWEANISNFSTIYECDMCGVRLRRKGRTAETVEILLIKLSEKQISVIFQRFTNMALLFAITVFLAVRFL